MLLKRGSVGNGVAVVQFALNGVTTNMPKLASDGIFGPKTEERVRQHQSQRGLQPDAVVGPLTLDSLFEIVKLRARVKFGRNENTERIASNRAVRSLVNRPPSLGHILNPGLAEHMRRQQAFLDWMAQPTPKPALPLPGFVVVPSPGFLGPLLLPVAHRQINLPGPPAKSAQVEFGAPLEGGAFTLSVGGEVATDVVKRKFKGASYVVELEWVMLKGRIAELAVATSIIQNNEGKFTGEAQVTLTGGSGLTLKTKLGKLGVLKFVPFLATAVATEGAIQAAGGVKLAAEFDVLKMPGNNVLKFGFGLKGAFKAGVGPVELPDGREDHQVTVTPFGATGFFNFSGTF
ncbi:MAG: peptidoglycan-binding domain-containing protein [Pirellulaceae bacterium]